MNINKFMFKLFYLILQDIDHGCVYLKNIVLPKLNVKFIHKYLIRSYLYQANHNQTYLRIKKKKNTI